MKKYSVVFCVLVLVFAFACCFTVSAENTTAVTVNEHPDEIVIDNVSYVRGTECYNVISGDGEVTEIEVPGNFYIVTSFFTDEELAQTMTEINVESHITGLPVTVIATNSADYGDGFLPCNKAVYPNITKVNLPDTIKEIYSYAFAYFPNVEELNLTDNLENVGEGAFGKMKSLKKIYVSQKLKEFSPFTFYNCESLSEITIGDNIKSIGKYCFTNCTSLKTVALPESIESIGNAAFKNTGLTSVTVPVVTWKIGDAVFKECKNLTDVTFNGSEEYDCVVSPYCFKNCTALTSVSFPENCKSVVLGKQSFVNCYYLKTLYFNSLTAKISVTHTNVFKNCLRLNNVYYAASEKRWNSFVKDQSKEEKVFKYLDIYYYYNHVHSYQKIGEDATCIKSSTITFSCSCGYSYTNKYAKNNNHSYGPWKTVKNPTVSEYGSRERTCSLCGKVAKKKVAKLIKISDCKSYVKDIVYDNGNPVTPKVTIYDKDNKELKKNVHYKLTYENNTAIGKNATVTIKGISKNGYTGTKTLKFSILPASTRINYDPSYTTDTSIRIYWKKVPEATGYTVSIVKVESEEAEKSYDTKKTSYTIKNLEPQTKYSIVLKSYTEVDGSRVENSYSFFVAYTRRKNFVLKKVSEDRQRVVIDNVVYCLNNDEACKLGDDGIMKNYPSNYGDSYYVASFFDDKEKAKTMTKINIVSEINGLPVTSIFTNYNGENYGGFDPESNDVYPNITKIVLPESIEEIEPYSFTYFPNVKELILPEKLFYIGKGAFAKMTSLKEITIPSKITEIPAYAFNGCSSLEKVTLNGKVEKISYYCFENCTSLKSINLPKKMKALRDGAFKNTGLTSVTLPSFGKMDEGIGNAVFRNCKNLKKATVIGSSGRSTVISKYCFAGCENLKTVVLPDKKYSVIVCSYAFDGCKNLSTIKNASSISSMWNYTFRNCQSLKSFVISDKVSGIGKSAFYNCKNIEEITIGSGVKQVEKNAFEKCKKLKKITITSKKKAPDFKKDSMKGTPSNIKFMTKNTSVAKLLRTELKNGTSVKKAKIYADGKLVYKT